MFQNMKAIFVITKGRMTKIFIGFVNMQLRFGRSSKVYQFRKLKPIIITFLNPKDVNNIFLWKVTFFHLKLCHIPQDLNQELQNLPFPSLTPLKTKHSDRYLLTVAPIIDFFIRFEDRCHLTSTNANCNFHCSIFVTCKWTIDRVTRQRHIC
jgi:hypothetical protein